MKLLWPKRLQPALALCAALAALAALAAPATATAAARSRVAFAPYVDLTQYPAPKLTAIGRAAGVHQMTLAFVTARATTACTPSWGGYRSLPASGVSAYDRGQITSLQHDGIVAVVSFGGEAGAELATTCRTPAALARAYDAVIDAYHPRRIDFDVEGAAVADPASIDRRSRALVLVQKAHPRLAISLTLPVLPSGLDSNGRAVVRDADRHHLRLAYVNLMTMDYGDDAAPHPQNRMGDFAIFAARATIAQLRAMRPHTSRAALAHTIGITPMIGINDQSDEIFGLVDASAVATYARTSGIGLLSMWQLERDRQCARPTDSAQIACSGVAETAYQFARAFKS